MVYYRQFKDALTHIKEASNLLNNIIGVTEASKLWGLAPGTIKNYCAEGRIKAKKIGNTWVIDMNQPNPKEEKEMTWSFDGYEVIEETDVLRFENLAGDVIGYVAKDDSVLEALEDGEDPIEDGWEDGVGNVIEITGWGNEAPQDLETMVDRLRALLYVDGENEQYMTLHENAESIFEDGNDQERFESQFNVKIDELQFPIAVIDQQSAVGGDVFQANEIYELRDRALEYFKRK